MHYSLLFQSVFMANYYSSHYVYVYLCTHPATKMRGISEAKASAISLLPTFAMQCRAKFMKVGLRLPRSFLMPLLIRRIRSLLEFTSTEMKR